MLDDMRSEMREGRGGAVRVAVLSGAKRSVVVGGRKQSQRVWLQRRRSGSVVVLTMTLAKRLRLI